MKKYLARNHKFYIQIEGNWLQISGIASWSIAYTADVETLAKFNNSGWGGSIVTGRSGTITLEGFYLVDATGQRDAGQLACDTASAGLGYHGLRGFKIEAYDDAGSTIGLITTSGVFNLENRGGNVRGVLNWRTNVTLKGIPSGSGIYNIFSQETYPPPEPDVSRSGMWTGVLGMYTYAE